jgi:hypothetical protein
VKKITMVVPPAQETKRLVTEQNTAERAAPTPSKAPASSRKTPSKRDVATVEEKTLGPSSTCNALIKRLKKAISNSPSPEVIRGQFDTGFSINEERVNSILGHLKVKNKWDYKEKAKKQEAVIKELRDCHFTTFAEIKTVREQCLLHESHVNNLIRDSYEEFLEVSQNLNTLHATSLKAQNELIKAQDELRNTSSTMMKFKTDQSPLRNRNKEFETRIIELQAQLVLEQTQADQMAADYAKVQAEHAELKSKSEAAIATMKEEYEQVGRSTFCILDEIGERQCVTNYSIFLLTCLCSASSSPWRVTATRLQPSGRSSSTAKPMPTATAARRPTSTAARTSWTRRSCALSPACARSRPRRRVTRRRSTATARSWTACASS